MEQTAKVFKGLKPHILHGTNKYDKNHHTLISTLQTAYRRDINPDVIIIDEIHYGYSGKMIKELIKDRKNIQIIGLSATPYDESGNLLDGFEVILNKYDMKYMIQNRYLVPIRSFILTRPDLSEINIIAGDYDIKQLGKVVCDNNTILEIVSSTKEFIKKSNKTIVFAVDINHAELLSKAYYHEGFTTSALHSNLKKDAVQNEIERFKKGYTKVLVSVLMLTTGFDVPETDVAIIARPTRSQNLYKQMVGRIARLAKNKNYGVLLDCGNVIENLGKPLDPIKPIIGNQIENRLKCTECESENLKLRKNKEALFWECKDCGFIKEIDNRHLYKCEYCNKEHSYESNFELLNNKLYLNCECGYETLISEFSGQEKFVEVEEDIKYIDKLPEIKYINEFLEFKDLIYLTNQEKIESISKRIRNISQEKTIEFISRFEKQLLILKDLEKGRNHSPEYFLILEIIKILKLQLDNLPFPNEKSYDIYEIVMMYNIQTAEFIEELINLGYEYKSTKQKIPLRIINNVVDSFRKKELSNKDDFLSFEDARKFARSLKYNKKSSWDYHIEHEKDFYFPENIPINPETYYKDRGWISWQDWLVLTDSKLKEIKTNTETPIKKEKKRNSSHNVEFLSFEIARDFVRRLEIRTTKDWNKYCINELEGYEKKPDNIPRSPEQMYRRKGWINYKDWLNERQMIFSDAKEFVKRLDLTTKDEWLEYCRNEYKELPEKPTNIPRDPDLRYRKEWKNWEDWLRGSTNRIYGEWKDFKEAREFIRRLGIENTLDWKKYCKGELEGFNKKPEDIPAAPDDRYKDSGWVNYADWLGTENIRKSAHIDVWLSYEEAKRFVHFLNLKSFEEWTSYIDNEMKSLPSKPTNIPKSPSFVYKNEGWVNWHNWLGIKKIEQTKSNEYYQFEEARSYVHSLKLKSIEEWKYYCEGLMMELGEIPEFIPKNPKEIYKNKGWWGINDWIGIRSK